jgi:hypothetical protein
MFAGDWVRMPFPCGLMERAVSSGLLAANAILQREGVQRRTNFLGKSRGGAENLVACFPGVLPLVARSLALNRAVLEWMD